jgi:hypothetical protein
VRLAPDAPSAPHRGQRPADEVFVELSEAMRTQHRPEVARLAFADKFGVCLPGRDR